MPRNTIDLNKINARLGDMNKPQVQRDAYVNDYDDDSVSDVQFREIDDRSDEDHGNLSNSTFYASIIGLFFMIGGGTFFSSDIMALFPKSFKTIEPTYTSGVDSTCGTGWKTNLPNVDQMHCYMTDTVSRLCDPKEKARLVQVIGQFQDDFAIWQGKIAMAGFGAAMKTNLNAIEMSVEDVKSRDKRLTPEQRMEHEKKLMDIAASNMSGVSSAEAEGYANHFTVRKMEQLARDYKKLAQAGYLSREDFGYTAPQFVSDDKYIGEVHPVCPKTP
jgi:hypothetical protein